MGRRNDNRVIGRSSRGIWGCLSLICGLLGCGSAQDQGPTPGTITEDLIHQHRGSSVDQTTGLIAASLVPRTVFLRIPDEASVDLGLHDLDPHFRFATAKDNQGRSWAWAYTNRAEFSRAFPQGAKFAETSFPRFFRIIERDE